MGVKIPRNTTVRHLNTTSSSPILPPILVTPRQAFRALTVSDKVGYRLVREKIIPTIRLTDGIRRVPVDELRRLLAEMVQVDHICRTCERKDPNGKCAAWTTPPKNVKNCSAWTFDQDWNLKLFAETREYEGKKK